MSADDITEEIRSLVNQAGNLAPEEMRDIANELSQFVDNLNEAADLKESGDDEDE